MEDARLGEIFGREAAELERTDDLEFIARVVSPIPDRGHLIVRYSGLSASAHRRKVRKAIAYRWRWG